MKTALLLSARSGSKRLPNKHFAMLLPEFSALDILCGRLRHFFPSSDFIICIATTEQTGDEVFEKKHPPGVKVFRGSSENIPFRQLQASTKLGADLIVAIDGDDIFTAPEAVMALIEKYRNSADRDEKIFYTEGLPFGMNVSCYSKNFLSRLVAGKEKQRLETGWGRIFPANSMVSVPLTVTAFPDKLLRFTLDYDEDLEFFKKIAGHFGSDVFKTNTEDIIKYVIMNEVFKINETVVTKYWENFHREKGLEEDASK